MIRVFVFSFLCLFFTVLRKRNHLLTTLMALELLMLLLIRGNVIMLCIIGVQLECIIYVVVRVRVCEASIGLRLLVAIIRVRGRVVVKALSLCW